MFGYQYESVTTPWILMPKTHVSKYLQKIILGERYTSSKGHYMFDFISITLFSTFYIYVTQLLTSFSFLPQVGSGGGGAGVGRRLG